MSKQRKKPKKPDAELMASIRQFIKATHISPSTFGRAVANDPSLIDGVKKGRELRRELRAKVLNYIRTHSAEQMEAAE